MDSEMRYNKIRKGENADDRVTGQSPWLERSRRNGALLCVCWACCSEIKKTGDDERDWIMERGDLYG